ncbi:hypothetical protein D3C71_1677830 [compost metagenome]
MQDQHAVAALNIHCIDHRFTQLLPIRRGHVGAVDQRRHLAKAPLRHHQLRLAVQIVAHPRFETGRRGQAVGAGLHADGAAGVEHHDVLGGRIGRGIHGSFSKNDDSLFPSMTPVASCVTSGAGDAPGFLPISVALRSRLPEQLQPWRLVLAGSPARLSGPDPDPGICSNRIPVW